jgi:hypothetical protein
MCAPRLLSSTRSVAYAVVTIVNLAFDLRRRSLGRSQKWAGIDGASAALDHSHPLVFFDPVARFRFLVRFCGAILTLIDRPNEPIFAIDERIFSALCSASAHSDCGR